jgi:CBS domain-containing protein
MQISICLPLPSGTYTQYVNLIILLLQQAQPTTFLADVMSRTIITASPEQSLEEVNHYFSDISGLPVVDHDHKCVGVLSKKDGAKSSSVSYN